MTPRPRLFTKYFALIAVLVSGALIASSAIGLWFSYQESKAALTALQREKAVAAAYRIEQYVRSIEHEIGWTMLPRVLEGVSPLEQSEVGPDRPIEPRPQFSGRREFRCLGSVANLLQWHRVVGILLRELKPLDIAGRETQVSLGKRGIPADRLF